MLLSIGLIILGLILLYAGGETLLRGAVGLATLLRLTPAVIGLTVVAAGTSVPELAVSATAAAHGNTDIAVANIVGSNLFNILVILGVTGLASPLPVQPALIASDCWWMLGVTLLLFPLMFTGRQINRVEGFLLMAVYGAYLTLLLRASV